MFHLRHVPEISMFHLSKRILCSNASILRSEMSTAKEKMAVWRTWKEIGVFSLNFHSDTDIPDIPSFRILSVLQDFLGKNAFKSQDQK